MKITLEVLYPDRVTEISYDDAPDLGYFVIDGVKVTPQALVDLVNGDGSRWLKFTRAGDELSVHSISAIEPMEIGDMPPPFDGGFIIKDNPNNPAGIRAGDRVKLAEGADLTPYGEFSHKEMKWLTSGVKVKAVAPDASTLFIEDRVALILPAHLFTKL